MAQGGREEAKELQRGTNCTDLERFEGGFRGLTSKMTFRLKELRMDGAVERNKVYSLEEDDRCVWPDLV